MSVTKKFIEKASTTLCFECASCRGTVKPERAVVGSEDDWKIRRDQTYKIEMNGLVGYIVVRSWKCTHCGEDYYKEPDTDKFCEVVGCMKKTSHGVCTRCKLEVIPRD